MGAWSTRPKLASPPHPTSPRNSLTHGGFTPRALQHTLDIHDPARLSRSLGFFVFGLEHARLWTAQDFTFAVLQRRPRFSQAGNRQRHARAFFLVVRFPEIPRQSKRCFVSDVCVGNQGLASLTVGALV